MVSTRCHNLLLSVGVREELAGRPCTSICNAVAAPTNVQLHKNEMFHRLISVLALAGRRPATPAAVANIQFT
jgi:hypothetical protein